MNWLQRKRTANALRSSVQQQAMLDNAPVGSVGAPGGLLGAAPTQAKPFGLGGLLAAGSAIPGVGDAVGLLGDAAMYASDPKSRTWGNALMTGLGALPFVPSAQQLAELAGPLSAMVVYHGSPHKFDAFDMSKIGTGEGAQAYGHGLYFAEAPEVAKTYITPGLGQNMDQKIVRRISEEIGTKDPETVFKAVQQYFDGAPKRPAAADLIRSPDDVSKLLDSGSLYTVDLPDEAIAKMLDWDKPLSEQAPEVRNAIFKDIDEAIGMTSKALESASPRRAATTQAELDKLMRERARLGSQLGADYYRQLSLGETKGQPAGSQALAGLGIPGIRYLDGGSRSGGKGTSNFVVFDDKLPKILKRE